jgi:hypothetical protein
VDANGSVQQIAHVGPLQEDQCLKLSNLLRDIGDPQLLNPNREGGSGERELMPLKG